MSATEPSNLLTIDHRYRLYMAKLTTHSDTIKRTYRGEYMHLLYVINCADLIYRTDATQSTDQSVSTGDYHRLHEPYTQHALIAHGTSTTVHRPTTIVTIAHALHPPTACSQLDQRTAPTASS